VYVIVAVFTCGLVCGAAFAKVVVKGPAHRVVVVKGGPKHVVVKKFPGRGVVVVKKVWLQKRTVVIAGKPFHYTPWRFIGRIVIISPAMVMAHPNLASAVIAPAPVGSEFPVIEEFDGWYHVKTRGKDGWVQKDKVDVTEVKETVGTEEAK
jgi:hypothetical protein